MLSMTVRCAASCPWSAREACRIFTDLKYLRGIDVAILPVDALEYARDQRLFPGIEDSLTYIAKLYNQELHLLARSDIKKIADLSGQAVNADVQGSSTAFTAARVFNLLGIQGQDRERQPGCGVAEAAERGDCGSRVCRGETGPFLSGHRRADGLHLLSIPLTPAVTEAYIPSRITAADYPRLVASEQPTDTIAVGTVMVAAELRNLSDRYRTIADFVDALFANFKGCSRRVIIRSGGRSISPRSCRAGRVIPRRGNGCSGMRPRRQHIGRSGASPLFALYRRAPSKRRQRPDFGRGQECSFPPISRPAERTGPLIDGIGQGDRCHRVVPQVEFSPYHSGPGPAGHRPGTPEAISFQLCRSHAARRTRVSQFQLPDGTRLWAKRFRKRKDRDPPGQRDRTRAVGVNRLGGQNGRHPAGQARSSRDQARQPAEQRQAVHRQQAAVCSQGGGRRRRHGLWRG